MWPCFLIPIIIKKAFDFCLLKGTHLINDSRPKPFFRMWLLVRWFTRSRSWLRESNFFFFVLEEKRPPGKSNIIFCFLIRVLSSALFFYALAFWTMQWVPWQCLHCGTITRPVPIDNMRLKKEIGEYDDERCHLISFLNFHRLRGNPSAVICISKLLRGGSEGWGQNWFLWELIIVEITKQHRWASTSAFMSAISDILHRHLLFLYRNQIWRTKSSHSDIDISFHFDIGLNQYRIFRYLNLLN
jgi:hypothetical protein